MTTAVVLFTRDLRVHDQPALAEAADRADRVVPLFVVDDRLVRAASPNRLAFLGESLGDLRGSLRKRGADLVVRRGDPVAETVRIARECGAAKVFAGEDASQYAQAREERLTEACRGEGVELALLDTISVVPPGLVTPAGRDHYRVFTPYWRRWRDVPVRSPLRAPRRLRLPDGVEPGAIPELAPGTQSPEGGESAGRRQLDRWRRGLDGSEHALARYSGSRLSPYFHFGCVSAVEAAARLRDHPHGAEFVRQLCWRDFFQQLLEANPRTQWDDFRPRGGRWRDDPDALARWSEGRTGCAIVDAGMRQLAAEGWLPNRARLIVASYLTRTLGLDWRLGADVFSRLLVDADVASNIGNWQWVAGTGADTRPNRTFSPARQAKRFDPDGEYVRRWVPELG